MSKTYIVSYQSYSSEGFVIDSVWKTIKDARERSIELSESLSKYSNEPVEILSHNIGGETQYWVLSESGEELVKLQEWAVW